MTVEGSGTVHMPGQFLTETSQWFIHSVSLRHLWGHEVVSWMFWGKGEQTVPEAQMIGVFRQLSMDYSVCVSGGGSSFWGG